MTSDPFRNWPLLGPASRRAGVSAVWLSTLAKHGRIKFAERNGRRCFDPAAIESLRKARLERAREVIAEYEVGV